MQTSKKFRPCSCGSTSLALTQTDSNVWEVRCPSCTAHTVGKTDAEIADRWNEAQFLLYDRQQMKFQNGQIKDCCQDPRNLIFKSRKYDLKTYVCRICGCRHRKVWAEPGRIFGAPVITR